MEDKLPTKENHVHPLKTAGKMEDKLPAKENYVHPLKIQCVKMDSS